jgi:ABC-2 type transport system ATP-binding protein
VTGSRDAHAVEVEDVTIAYGERTVLEDVSFEVRPGEVFGLIGLNGAGKTSIMECIEGLRRPARGRIRVLGRDAARDRRELAGLVGVQLQDGQLPSRATVDEVTRLFASLYPRRRSAAGVLASVGLTERRASRVERLSGGERQRLAVALALLGDPRLLCLDELTTGLDPHGRQAIWGMVQGLRDEGIAIVLTSHYMDEVERLCSRVALLRGGTTTVADSTRELVATAGCPHRFTVGTSDLDAAAVADLRAMPTVSDWSLEDDRVAFRAQWPLVAEPLEAAIARHNVSPLDVSHDAPSLEEAFISLTRTG